MRTFDTGAIRDANIDKKDYRGFLSARVIQRFGDYMHQHRQQADGGLRAADNWKKGIPIEAYEESLVRHTIDFMRELEDGCGAGLVAEDLACAILFNLQGWLHERLKAKDDMMIRQKRV